MTTNLPQQRNVQLSESKLTAIQTWKVQPKQSYAEIRLSTPRAMIKADTPNLWEIRNHTDHPTAIGIIVLALLYTARLVNVESNLNEDQIGEIANDVLNDYGYLKVEEVKYILKTAVRTKKIFGRLDYNVVMEWFEEYDSKRTEEATKNLPLPKRCHGRSITPSLKNKQRAVTKPHKQK